MRSIKLSSVAGLILHYKNELDMQQKSMETKLQKLIDYELFEPEQLAYTKLLRKKSREIITADPSALEALMKLFDSIINSEEIATKSYEVFRKQIISSLGYSKLRSDFYPRYFFKLGIKACVYCNSQSTLSIKRTKIPGMDKTRIQGKFQVDHYISKNSYPCFSISLFNLYPVCGSCNNVKGTNKIDFLLYTSKSNTSSLQFYLAKESHGRFLISRDPNDIIIGLKSLQKTLPPGFSDFAKLFEIEGIYEQYKDVAEELILKAEIYTPAYKLALVNSFPDFIKPENIDRIITGNYTLEEDIHKRPLSKFVRDISKSIGLIKEDWA